MKNVKLRAFTERGLAEFKDYLARGPLVDTPPPTGLLLDDTCSAELGFGSVQVRKFETKFDMGMAVAVAAGKENVHKLFADDNVWPWLSLLFHETTIPKKDENWFVGARSRHVIEKIPGRQQDQSNRHLVKGATMNVVRFGTHARVLMDRPDGQSKIEEQVMSRHAKAQFSSSETFVKLLNRLYWDSETNTVRRGARGTGPGSVPRLIMVLKQFDRTFDVPAMPTEEIVKLLPENEFGKFLASPVKGTRRATASMY